MKKAILIFVLLLTMLCSFAAATDGGNVTNTGTNFTIFFSNTGTFQFLYTGFKNITFNETQGWINVTNGTNSVLYNISSGESWALYQDPTTCVMPVNDVIYTYSPSLCNGKYYMTDTNNGVLRITTTNGLTLNCNGGIYKGNTSGRGVQTGANNTIIKNCNMTGYSSDIQISSNTYGIIIQNNSLNKLNLDRTRNISVLGNIFHLVSGNSIYLYEDSQNLNTISSITNNTFLGNTKGITGGNFNNWIITNNTFTNSTNTIILSEIGYSINNSVINNNKFYLMSSYSSNVVTLITNSFNNVVSGNIFNGTNKDSKFAMIISGSNSNNNTLIGNTCNKIACVYINVPSGTINFIKDNICKNLNSSTYACILGWNTTGQVLVSNNSILNSQNYIEFYQGSSNFNITGNYLENDSFIYILDSSIFVINNNTGDGLFMNSSYPNSVGTECMRLANSSSFKIYNNDCSHYGHTLSFSSTMTNGEVYNNILHEGDKGVSINTVQGNNFTFRDNIIKNITMNFDDYDVGIKIMNSSNINVYRNNMTDLSVFGVLVQKSRNIQIINTSCEFINLSQRTNYFANDINEGQTCIAITQLYKTWIGGGLEITDEDNITYISQFSSDNITLTGTTWDEDTQIILKTQGVSNLTTDIVHNLNNWYRKIQPLIYLSSPIELYINNNFDELTHTIKANTGIITNMFFDDYSSKLTYSSIDHRQINFTISKTLMTFKNVNATAREIAIYNLTPPYNDIMNRSNNRVIAVGVSSYTITLGAGERIEVGDFTYCGDGIFQYLDDELIAEECDGADYNGETCFSLGYPKGTLSCDTSCNYVLTDCQSKSAICQSNIVPLTGITSWIGLLVTILCIAFVFILFTNQNINIKVEGDTFYAAIVIIISVGVLIGIGLLILGNLC